MTGKHMTYERGGLRKPKKKAVKTTKKSQPAVKRQLKAAQRQVWNVLGGAGFIWRMVMKESKVPAQW